MTWNNPDATDPPSRTSQLASKLGTGVKQVEVPAGGPRFLGNQRTIVAAWFVSMALVCADEFKSHHIFPRPARLWYTSLVFGVLALMAFADSLIPLANILAIGYAIVLTWQFFNKSGQFSG